MSNILIIDDNLSNIQILFEMLQTAGYRVAIAKNAESALDRLQRNLPDLILLDVMMPGIDGFELCRRFKSDPKINPIPVIFMTALTDEGDLVRGLELGAVDYITKPIQQKEALARIQLHLKLHQLNEKLEEEVAQRTADLNQALRDLKQTQVHLVQNEKLSSLGQMVAGIAHEINNPITFIYGNLEPMHSYAQQLLRIIDLLLEDKSVLSPQAQAYLESADLEFVQEDFPKVLDSLQVGAERIRDIILSLRNFARLDEAEKKRVDIQTGIESTLLILQNRLKARPEAPAIQVVKHYGSLPEVECYPSQLNQVFMNILSNAIDALEERNRTRTYQDMESDPCRIQIRTRQIGNRVKVQISDNGPGIPEDVCAKMFEPFFTTKEVGKGTGLGLSISHQIVVNKHGGRMSCTSTPGKGTNFVVEIPILQHQSSHGADQSSRYSNLRSINPSVSLTRTTPMDAGFPMRDDC